MTTIRRFALVLIAAAALVLPGCESRTRSPYSGEMVTHDQLTAEAAGQVDRIEAETAQQLRAAERETLQLQRQFELAVSKLNADAAHQVAELGAKFDQDRSAVADALDEITAARVDQLAGVRRGFELGTADISRQDAARGAVGDFLQSGAVSGIPLPYVGSIGALAGVLGAVFGQHRGERRGWDEAIAHASTEQTKRDAAYDEGAVRARSPGGAA